MTCHEAEAMIVRAADGYLDAGSRRDLETHTAVCPECSARLAGHAAVAMVLRNRPMSTTPPGLTDAVMARLDRGRGWLGAADWRRWSVGLVPVMTAAVIAAAVIVRAPSGSPATTETEYAAAEPAGLLLDGRISTSDELIDLALGGFVDTGDANEGALEGSTR